MIKCPNCGHENNDDRAGRPCVDCDEPLPEAAPDEDSSNPFDKFQVLVEPSSSTGQNEQEDQRRREEERKREKEQERKARERQAAAAQDEDDEEDIPLDPNHLDAITEYGRARAIVSVIGFANSGKTFFVNRLRDWLGRSGWKRSPKPARQIPLSPEGIELSRFVPMDVRPRKGSSYSYIMVDCAGESFTQALEAQFKTEALAGVQGRSYLAAIALAKAYIMVIRAEDLLGLSGEPGGGAGRSRSEFVEDVVLGFDDIISAIVVSKERLRSRDGEHLLREGLSHDDLKGVLERNQVRCSQPLCIVFSLADRLEKDSKKDSKDGSKDDSYDADPFLFALHHAPALVKAVDRTFDYYRFDFLSAFYQHDADSDSLDNIRPDYRKESYGAQDSFLWLHEMLKPRSMISRVGRFASGSVPTRRLVALRRKLDPDFDRAWRDA
jgi:hypothetical protein